MLPPRLSRRSRRKAGESAVKARQERAKVKELITNGELFFFDLFEDERKSVKRMKLMDLLQSVPGIGKVRAEIVMSKAQISPSRRIGGVGKRQLEILRQEFLLIKNSRRSGKLLVVSGPSGVGKVPLQIDYVAMSVFGFQFLQLLEACEQVRSMVWITTSFPMQSLMR